MSESSDEQSPVGIHPAAIAALFLLAVFALYIFGKVARLTREVNDQRRVVASLKDGIYVVKRQPSGTVELNFLQPLPDKAK